MGHSTVMLSTFAPLSVNSAKHLAAQRDRPFAALRVTVEGLINRLLQLTLFICIKDILICQRYIRR